AFQKWPSTPALLRSQDFIKNLASFPVLGQARGFDRNPEMVNLMKKRGLTAEAADLFATETTDLNLEARNRFVIVNPPYGERLKVDFTPQEFLQTLQKKFRPDRCGILLPQSQAEKLARSEKVLRSTSFLNGGIPVQFLVFSK